jgi:phosphinothricin acetyltransferase
MVRSVTADDATSICGIYNFYVKTTAVTFEEIPVSINEMEKRVRSVTPDYPWLVWEEEGEILGYAYIHRWMARSSYRYSAEDSIYVKDGARGRGIGTKLLAALLEAARHAGIHALVAGITLPNERSVGIHEKFGFTKIAEFVEIGFKMNQWLNVGYWQLLLGEGQRGAAAP